MRVLQAGADTLPSGALERWAARAEHEVLSVADADAVREACIDRPPELLILDWDLPGGARDVCRWLGATLESDAPRVILCVPPDDGDALDAALGCGADDILLHGAREQELAIHLRLAEHRVRERTHGTIRSVSRGRRAETVLRNVLEGTSATTGKDFFRSLVRHLSQALEVRHALVAELLPGEEGHMQTLAVWSGNAFRENRTFELVALPSAEVLRGMSGAAAVGEASLFPGARFLAELDAASYLGVPLANADGASIGLLFVLHDGPMPTGPDALRILTTFAQRAGAELARLRVQRRLASSESRMRAMIDAMPDLLFRQDAEGRFLSTHAPDPDQLYTGADEVVGKTPFDVLPADLAEAVMAKLHAALETDEVQILEYKLPVPSGGEHFEARLVRCGANEVLTVVRDVTARVRAEQERRELDRRMQQSQKLESLGVLAGGIAHDFNNLLTSIMGYASLAQRSTTPDTPPHRYVADIVKASRRAADLAMQMLAYSGKGRFVIQLLDLREVIRETTELLKTDLLARGVHLELKLPPAIPAIEGDVTQLRQVLMNLLLNAAQAMEPAGGTATIRLESRTVREAEFACCYVGAGLASGTYVSLSISDTGCGMDAATATRIFDPFFTTKTGGRGLGLAAAVGIVRGHRGALSVRSAPGKGTTVAVCFPPSEKPARGPAVERPRLPVRGEGLILVVDDEPELRRLATSILQAGGYRAVTASEGKQGVDLFRQRADEFDAVLLDLTMPVMGGVEAFHLMREVRPDVRVVVSSGFTEQDAIVRFQGDAPTAFIQKPYTATDLLSKITEVVAAF